MRKSEENRDEVRIGRKEETVMGETRCSTIDCGPHVLPRGSASRCSCSLFLSHLFCSCFVQHTPRGVISKCIGVCIVDKGRGRAHGGGENKEKNKKKT